jgi:CRP-like cAMP-binding protein
MSGMVDDLVKDRLIRRLLNFIELSMEEQRVLCSAVGPIRFCRAHEDIAREGDPTADVHVILSGFACLYKMLPDGRRQIVGYFLPGDICDSRVFILHRMDHTISTLSPAKIATLSRDGMLSLTERYPRIARALWWATLVEEAMAREWLVNVGQRTALERLAHLFCEIFARLRAVGLTVGASCELPLTQAELADTLALSTVHVNRTLKELRRLGVISVTGKKLTIHDFQRLQLIAMFDANYLHLEGERPVPGDRRVV